MIIIEFVYLKYHYIIMSCSTYPYNINEMNTFNEYITNVNYIDNVDASNNIIDFSLWQKCISKQKKNKHVDLNLDSINTILNTYNIEEQTRNDTANESNKYSMTLFQNDIYYTYGKIVFFIILIGAYMYFFKVNGIMEPIMNLFNSVKTKVMVDLPKSAGKILEKKANSNSLKNKLSAT
jgi:hypothetical protein